MHIDSGASRAQRRCTAAVAACALGALVAVGATYVTTPGVSGDVWNVAWQLASFAALAGMLGARGAAAPADRPRWTMWAAAAASWAIGQALWAIDALVWPWGSPTPADVFWWGFALLVIISLLRTPARSRSVRAVGRAEALPIMGAGIALSLALLWRDASRTALDPAAAGSALVYPAVYVVAAVLTLQSMVSGGLRGARSAALRLVLAGMAIQAACFSLWSEQLLDGSYVPGHTVLDPLWVIGLIAIGAGGALAARRAAPTTEIAEPGVSGGLLPAVMFVALIAALIDDQLNGAAFGARVMLAAGLLLSGCALIARSALLERGLRTMLNRERAALAALSEREAELAALNAQLVEDSRRDALTGLRNRRALMEDIAKLEAMRRRGGAPYAVALCDIDHFKRYNDDLGHLAGDQALRTIAQTIRGALRDGDGAYRYGGEEFLLVLRGAESTEAIIAAERIRLAIEAVAVPLPSGHVGNLTVSIGVAGGNADFPVQLGRADAALYRAKRGGRNRTEVAEDEPMHGSVGAGGVRGLRGGGRAAGPGAADGSPVGEAGIAGGAALARVGAGREQVEEPVPRHLRAMMAISRAAATGRGEPAVLQALAETIRSELSFHVVAINTVDRVRREVRCVIVLGDEEARATLLDTVRPWSEWEAAINSAEHQRLGAVWLPDGADPFDPATTWTPAMAAAPGDDAWQPEDMLLLPLRSSAGDVLGIVSVDAPVSGRRPDDAQIAFLMSVADHAALALEQSRREQESTAAVREQSAELRLAAVMLLAETLDLRDPGTARHSRTVGAFARSTARALGLAEDQVERIHAAGVLHDLGKLGIADAILFKPDRLTDAEWLEIQRHPEVGSRILENAGLSDIAGWVRSHHERIDGDGYPDRLRGDEIALEARILAVCDAYEAMIADRPYRAGMSVAQACAELERCAGTQFDPVVVAAFVATLGADAPPEPAAAAVVAAV